jgi:hypothetical protein
VNHRFNSIKYQVLNRINFILNRELLFFRTWMRVPTKMTSLRHLFTWLINFKSPWYYWYQGRKVVALAGMTLGMGIMAFVVLLTSGFNVVPLVLTLVLDHVLILLALLYVILRIFLPNYLNTSIADQFVLEQFLLFVVPGFLVVRMTTRWVARVIDATSHRARFRNYRR